jgi:curved DNA-binding protein
MEFKDYYAALGLTQSATPEEIKHSYRKLARKFHPDVSKEPDAEARFKDVAEAYKALKDPEKRAAYDEVARRYRHGQSFEPPPGWNSGFEFRGRGGAQDGSHGGDGAQTEAEADRVSEFFASLFGRPQRGGHANGGPFGARHAAGRDRHAKITIDLEDAYQGAQRTISLQVPHVDPQGQVSLQERQLDIRIPQGVREGQHLRLAGQGDPGTGELGAGDLYLEIVLRPHKIFRVDGRDVYLDLPVSPWEAALGATVTAPTPQGPVELTVPPDSASGRKLRLKGRGLPGTPPGDLYARLQLALPPGDSPSSRQAYAAMQHAFPKFAPRSGWEIGNP